MIRADGTMVAECAFRYIGDVFVVEWVGAPATERLDGFQIFNGAEEIIAEPRAELLAAAERAARDDLHRFHDYLTYA